MPEKKEERDKKKQQQHCYPTAYKHVSLQVLIPWVNIFLSFGNACC